MRGFEPGMDTSSSPVPAGLKTGIHIETDGNPPFESNHNTDPDLTGEQTLTGAPRIYRGSMSEDLRAEAQNVDVTVWVGKAGIDSVREELADQLDSRELVKVKFLRSARGNDDTEDLAAKLADLVDAELVETRGNTGVYH